jgi:hypothetical protein
MLPTIFQTVCCRHYVFPEVYEPIFARFTDSHKQNQWMGLPIFSQPDFEGLATGGKSDAQS